MKTISLLLVAILILEGFFDVDAIFGGRAQDPVVVPVQESRKSLFGHNKASTGQVIEVKGGSTKTKSRPSSAKSKVKVSQKVTPPPPPPPPAQVESSSLAKRGRTDSLEAFADDIATVLKELRADTYDPTVNSMYHSAKRPTFAVTWTHEMWENHTSRWRFVNQFLYWHKSALLKRVFPQLCALMLWTYAAIRIVDNKSTVLSNIHFPMTSLSLVSGFVGSLLALRTNQGLARLMEARQYFGKTVHYTRDMSSLIANFVYHKEPVIALKLARHLAIFSFVLKNFLRGRKVSGSDEDLIRTMLTSEADVDYVLRQRKMPVAILMRLRQGLHHLAEHHVLTTAEEIAIDHTIQAMDAAIMATERIVASPIPPLFTTHAGRLLVFYLFFLPIALHSSGSLNAVGTMVTVLAVGYAMLGLDEISHLMEQPFKVAPLYHLSKNSMRDVADCFCLHPPSLNDRENKNYVAEAQPYWTEGVHDGFE